MEELPEEEKLMKLSTLKLRYFTPREIANLHGFPQEFGKCCKVPTFASFFRNANVIFLLGTNPCFLFCFFFFFLDWSILMLDFCYLAHSGFPLVFYIL